MSVVEAVKYIIRHHIRNSFGNNYLLQNLDTYFVDVDIKFKSFNNYKVYEFMIT